MRQLSMWSMNKPTGIVCAALAALTLCLRPAFGIEKERDPVTLRVIAANPSAEKTQIIPVKIELPNEIGPKDILDKGDLELEYDDDRSIYYVYKDKVELAPKQIRVFEVVVRDLWFVPQEKLDNLKNYTGILLSRLKNTEYYTSAKQLAEGITRRLEDIAAMQMDEGLSRKTKIGNYRRDMQALEQMKEDLARLEKLLAFTGGPPVPRMLEESKLKSDSPSKTTTWLVIFLIMIFLGFLSGQFFFTWQGKLKSSQNAAAIRDAAFSILQKPEERNSSSTKVSGNVKKPQATPPGVQTAPNGRGVPPPAGASSSSGKSS